MNILTLTPPLLLSLLLCSGISVASQVNKGFEIASEMDQRNTGWADQAAELKMILSNRKGDESVRIIHTRLLEMLNDGDKGLTYFDHPPDVKGTTLLSYSHSKKPDDLWLFLPALKRVKRITSTNKTGPFMGSEFAYEDLTSEELDKYTYSYIKDDIVNDKDTFVIERRPTYEYSGYLKQIVWIDKTIYRPLVIEYYDKKNTHIKTLTLSGYNMYADKFWRANKWVMENHVTNKKTTLIWNNYRFGNGFTDRDFDKTSIKRMR